MASTLLAAAACGPAQQAKEPGAETPTVKAGLALASRVYEAADPAAAYAKLTGDERAQLQDVVTPGELVVEETITPEPSSNDGNASDSAAADQATPVRSENVFSPHYSGCYGWHQTYKRKALFGNTLYTYWQSTSVCVSNGTVTSVSVYDTGGETSTPGWRITHAPTTATKNVGWEGRGKAQYYFVLGAGGWDIQHPTDCIQQRLNGNGHDHVSSSSCDLG